MNKQCILVTGGCGLLGTALVNRLCKEEATVIVIDDLSRGRKEFLNPKAHLIVKDLQENSWKKILDAAQDTYGPLSYIYSLAARVGGVNYMLSNELASLKNAAIDWNVLSYAAERKIPLLYCSTACVYPIRQQTLEADHPPLQEDEATRDGAEPESVYGWAKLLGELTVARHTQESGIPNKIIRMFNLYGTHEVPDKTTGHVIPALIKKCIDDEFPLSVWGTGEQFRSFLYMEDAVDAILRVMRFGKPGIPYNIGNPERITIRDLAEIILMIHLGRTPKETDLRFDPTKPMGVFGRTANTDRICTDVGWTPKTSLHDGIQATYKWCYEYIHKATPVLQ